MVLLFSANISSQSIAKNTAPVKQEEQVTLMNWSFRNAEVQSSLMAPRSGKIFPLLRVPNPAVTNIEFECQGKAYTVRSAMIENDTDGGNYLKI